MHPQPDLGNKDNNDDNKMGEYILNTEHAAVTQQAKTKTMDVVPKKQPVRKIKQEAKESINWDVSSEEDDDSGAQSDKVRGIYSTIQSLPKS